MSDKEPFQGMLIISKGVGRKVMKDRINRGYKAKSPNEDSLYHFFLFLDYLMCDWKGSREGF
jgi:hypothetical protein